MLNQMEQNPVQNLSPLEDRTQIATQPSWRWVFLILLVATLLSALASTYILMTGKKPVLVKDQPSLETDNPFASEPETTNPFVSEVVTSNSADPFATTTSSNPFSQFDSDSSNTSTAGSSGEYENPF